MRYHWTSDPVITSLNPTLRGWYEYFQHSHRFTFSTIDGFVRRRLRAMLRRQMHRPGQGRCLRDHITMAECSLR
ncbi:MAG: group II intron maturase-specific domain-containing protein [Methylotenera sp.]